MTKQTTIGYLNFRQFGALHGKTRACVQGWVDRGLITPKITESGRAYINRNTKPPEIDLNAPRQDVSSGEGIEGYYT